jgi:hypothetical protein
MEEICCMFLLNLLIVKVYTSEIGHPVFLYVFAYLAIPHSLVAKIHATRCHSGTCITSYVWHIIFTYEWLNKSMAICFNFV